MKFETCHGTTAHCQLCARKGGRDSLWDLARRTFVLLLALLTDGTLDHVDEWQTIRDQPEDDRRSCSICRSPKYLKQQSQHVMLSHRLSTFILFLPPTAHAMHPNNPYHDNPPDFTKLASHYPSFRPL